LDNGLRLQRQVAIPFGMDTDPLQELSAGPIQQQISNIKNFDPLKPFRPRRLRSDFYFKDYASGTFHAIRCLSGVKDEQYIGGCCPLLPRCCL
jgi:hypothetical protein